MTVPTSAVHTERPRVFTLLTRFLQSAPVLLFGFFIGVYALTSAGRFDAADGLVVVETARALLLHHTLALPPNDASVVIGVGGLGYSKYGIAQSLVEMPFVALGLLAQHITGKVWMFAWVVAFTNTFVSALICAVFYGLVRRLGAGVRRAVALTLLYGLCTLVWPYAKTDFSEPLQTLSLVFAAYAVVRWRQSRSAAWLWLGGGALALAILTKSVLVLAVPAFVLYVLSEGILDGERRGILETIRNAGWRRVAIARLAMLLVPVVLGLAVTLWLNVVRFGSPLNFGYNGLGGDTDFSTPIWIGLFGLLFSLNSGLIFYATPVLLALPGVPRFVRRRPAEALLAGVLVGMLLLLYSGYQFWAGMNAFGPRYVVPLIPFILLPAVYAFPGLWSRRHEQRWVLALVCTVALLGFAEQLLGVIVSFETYGALTCASHCPGSMYLNASHAELLYDVWLLPRILAYDLLGHVPQIVPASYPFGSEAGIRSDWNGMFLDQMRYFWFVWLVHLKVAVVGGLVVCGSLIILCAARLSKIMRLFDSNESDTAPGTGLELASAPSGAGER
jgi:hypothetical protein